MNKLNPVTAALAIVLATGATQAGANLLNPGFETGTLANWISSHPGQAAVVMSHNGDFAAPFTYTPMEGNYFLRVYAPALTEVWATVSQTLNMAVGDMLSGWAAFDWRDETPFLDGAKVEVLNAAGLVATPFSDDGTGYPNYFDGPWTAWSWTATSAGSYTVAFSARNTVDDTFPSAGLFDVVFTAASPGPGPGPTPAPEPATLGLLGLGLLGLGFARRRRH